MNLSGSPLDFLAAFFGGVLVSFTPCIYPLLPVAVGYIGVTAADSRLKGLSLSLVYVSGMAITYAVLGLLAGLTGTFFGSISAHPLTRSIAGITIMLFGLSMLDLFTIALPRFLRPQALTRKSYLSVFLLGLSSGLIASPCLTPVLGSILLYLATKKNLLYGAILLLSFAYGMGLTLILAGTFSAFLLHLPRSGRWMVFIKRIFSVILLLIGAYFVYTGIRSLLW